MRTRRSHRFGQVVVAAVFMCSVGMVSASPAVRAIDAPGAAAAVAPAPDEAPAGALSAPGQLPGGPTPPIGAAPTSQPPVAAAGTDQTVFEGSLVSLDGSASSDPDGDPLTYAWTVAEHTGPAIALTAANTPAARFATTDDGVYHLDLTVSDGTTSASDEVVITVRNALPVLIAQVNPAYRGGVSVVTATITDAGLLDTQTATITWGDGTPAEQVAPSGQGAGWATIAASHVYAAVGSYPVIVAIVDDDGGVATTTLTPQVLSPVALWANGTSSDPVLEVTGGPVTITGLTHTNSDLKTTGSPDTFSGPTEYVRNLAAGKATFSPAAVRTAVKPLPFRFEMADYRPGGRASRVAGAAYRDMSSACKSGNWSVTGTSLASGVYYANCGVKITGSPTGGTITLAAEGDIVVSGSSAFFYPYMDGLLFISASISAQAIKFDGSQSAFIGHSFAERGRLILAGSNNTFDCGLLGDRIQVTGSNIIVRGSACAAPGRSGIAPIVAPTLTTALVVNRADTLPGQTLTHTATITNAGATLVATGVTGLENLGTSTVMVAGHTLALEYRSVTDGLWHPVPGTVTISVLPDPAAGVAYPSTGDRIDGTTVAPGALATWGLTAVAILAPADIRLLLDPARVAALRLGSTLATSPASVRVRRLPSLDEDLSTALRATGANVTDITATIVPPAGAPHAFTAPTTPALALLGPGEAAVVALDSNAPAPLPRASGESDAAYLARLATFDGALLTGTAFARGTTTVGPVATPPASVATTEHLPIVHLAKTGPATADAGTTVTYDLALSNTGSAAAISLSATDTVGSTPATVSGVPATLAQGAAATGHATFDIPDTTPDSDLVDDASVTWRDANGTTYGPVGSTFTTAVRGIHAVVPIQPVAIGPVSGNFYANTGVAHFTATPASTPAFGQDFPTIDFNPPDGTVLNNISGVGTSTRPFTDLTTDINGNFTGTIVAAGNGHQAGVGDLTHFDAVFTSTFAVTQASDVTFSVFSDAGFVLGVGGGATRVNGALENPPAAGTTPFQAYPVVGAYNIDSAPLSHLVTIHFPAAGSYPFELDYFECCDAQLSLTLSTVSFIGDQSPLSIYVGYADGLRPGGSVFPFPWKGSPGVVFIGDNGTYDSGALRFDNSSDVPIVLDKVTVEVAGHVFDLWGVNRAVPAHGTLIMAQTNGENFDSSDVRGGTCTPIGTIPHVRVTVGGVLTTYNDTKQVLNTGDIDYAVCPGGGNESHAWERIGGGGTPVNHALPPQTSLTIDPNTASATVGLKQSLVVTAMDAGGSVIPGLPITVRVSGVNSGTVNATTDAAGVATVSYIGTASGTDQVQARAFVGGLLAISDAARITWANPLVPGGGGTPSPFPPPSIGSVTPADGATVTEPVAIKATITPPAGASITDWKVTYQRVGTTGTVELASGIGDPPVTLATFDPTVVPNGTYLISVTANASNGGFQTSTTNLVVDGNLKLGRYVTTYQDLSVGVSGIPIQILRKYDSFDKSVGDFGVGWRLEIADFHASTGRPLGQGGWTMYNKQCFFGLCITGFTSSTPHIVTVTWPDGHEEQFDFTPDGGTNIFWTGTAAFTARPGSTSRLEVVGDNEVSYLGNGDLFAGFFGSSTIFDPQRFRLTDVAGTQYILDTTSGLVSETATDGTTITVTPAGVMSSRGPSIAFDRDAAGRIRTMTAPDLRTRTYGYDAAGDLRTLTDFNGDGATLAYDTGHDLLNVSGAGMPTQTLHYDPDGRLDSITDGENNTTHVEINVGDRTEILHSPDGRLTRILTYDTFGNLADRDDVFSGRTVHWSYEYDANHRLTAVEDPAHHRSVASWDGNGNLIHAVDAAGVTTDITYNAANRPTEVKVGGRVSYTATYDAGGRLDTVTRPGSPPTLVTYGPSGQVATVSGPDGETRTYSYDSNGYLAGISLPIGSTSFVNDAAGRRLAVTDPSGTIHYEYNGNGLVTKLIDQQGHSQSWTYNVLGQPVSYEDKAHQTISYTYDDAGRIASVLGRDGKTTSFTWTANGDLATRATPEETTAYSYDPLGRLTHASSPAAILDLAWDDSNRITSQRSRAGSGSSLPDVTIQNATDGAGRTTQSQSLGSTTSYGYDMGGLLNSVGDTVAGSFGFGYDTTGRPASLTRPNGVVDNFTFTDSGRLESRTTSFGGTEIDTVDYGYDANGRRNGITDADGLHSFGYDPAGRLETASHPAASGLAAESYTYDPAGNRIDGSAPAYDAADRRTEDATHTYTYDGEGRLTSSVVKATGAQTRFTWDALGQLLAIDYPDSTRTTFKYDALGRRVEVNHRGQIARFVYDGSVVRHVFDGGNQLVASYVWRPDGGGLLAVSTGSTVSFPVQDSLGGTSFMTGSTGTAGARSRHDAYGRPAAGTPSSVTLAAWAGLAADPTGLYFAQSRYYDAATGRFLSEDDLPATNAYIYGQDDPVNNVDPTGKMAVEYGLETEGDVAEACSASRAIVPLLDWIQLMVTLVDVFTAPGTAVFYSGAANEAAAKTFAEETGRFTISMTEGGKWLSSYGDLRNIFDPSVSRGIWEKISGRFASNTSGEVFAFVEGASPDSIFKTVEEPILQERGIKINYMPKSPCG